jgi:putative ABC transport system permease protein
MKNGDRPGTRVSPPRLATLIVRMFSAREVRDAVRADMDDRFGQMARRDAASARRWYWAQAIRCLNPYYRLDIRSRRPRLRASRASVVGESIQDIRYAVRGLVKQPGFAVTAVLTLGVGIGATTAIFSVVNGVLLRPLPYFQSERLVNVWQVNTDWFDSPNASLRSWAYQFPMSQPTFRDWEELNPVFQNIGAYDDRTYTVTNGASSIRAYGTRVTSGVWRTLGVAPVLGRVFVPDDDELGATPVVVLSFGFWQRHFGADPNVLGTGVRLGDVVHTVVGVMPRTFYFPSAGHDLWTNFDDQSRSDGRDTQYLEAIARLKPGVSLPQAQHEMELVTERMVESREHNPDYGIRLVPRIQQVVGDVQLILLVLLGAVGLVLLIACANIANMLLAKATERRRELAIRSALGAWRGRLLRQLLTESMVLSLVGGTAGVLVALVSFRPLVASLPSHLPRVDEIALDHRVLLFAVAVSIFTGLLAGALPALRAARTDLADVLQDGGRGFSGGRGRRRNWTQASLVISEIAVAFVLLVGAGLLVKSFLRLTSVERGFDAERVLVFDFAVPGNETLPSRSSKPRPPSALTPQQLQLLAYVGPLEERLEAIPGVRAVAVADNMPFMGGTSSGTTTIESSGGTHETNVERSAVSPSYFRVLGVPIVAGRAFQPNDVEGSERVAVVSRAMAEQYWPGEDPVGWRLKRGSLDSDRPWVTVVGVAEDVHHQGLHVTPRPKMYLPYAQAPRANIDVILKTHSAPDMVAAATREAVVQFDPTVPIPDLRELEGLISSSVAAPRFRTRLVSLLAVLAGLLAVIGVYGVLAYTMARRTAEVGIRMALGARAIEVVGSVVGRGARLALAGIALGLVVALVAVKLLDTFLFEINSHDPGIFLSAAALLTAAALAASYLPARRATRVDPVEALRSE